MKKLTLKENRDEINRILMKRKYIKEPLDFDSMTFAESVCFIMDCAKGLEYKVYIKQEKKPIKDLRYLYLMIEKYMQHEKRLLLSYRKTLERLKIDMKNEELNEQNKNNIDNKVFADESVYYSEDDDFEDDDIEEVEDEEEYDYDEEEYNEIIKNTKDVNISTIGKNSELFNDDDGVYIDD